MTSLHRWTLHRHPNLDPLRPLWNAASSSSPSTVFQSFAFAHHWLAAFADTIELHLWVHDDPPFLAPLILSSGVLGLVGEGLFDYLDFLGTPHPSVQLQALERLRATSAGPARFTGVRASSVFSLLWSAIATPTRYSAAPQRPALSGPITHSRTSSRWARAQAAGATVTLAHDPALRRELLDWILLRKQQTPANILRERECAFLRSLVPAEPLLCELWQLQSGAARWGALLCFLYRATRYAYAISYDRGAAELSPGVLLLHAVVERSMHDGVNFDFLTGEQSFKMRFSTHAETIYRYDL